MRFLVCFFLLLPQFASALELSILGSLAATQYNNTSTQSESRSDAYLTYGGGARLEIPLTSSFSFESGVHYLEQEFGFPSSRTYKTASLQLPALAKFWIGNFSLSGGLVGSYGLSEVDVAQDGAKQSLTYDEVRLNRLNVHLTGELGLALPVSDSLCVIAIAGYQRGLTDATSASDMAARLHAVVLHLGFRFGPAPGGYLAY